MIPSEERPLDFLNLRKGKVLYIIMMNGNTTEGKLIAYDIHINLILESSSGIREFVNGRNIQEIKE